MSFDLKAYITKLLRAIHNTSEHTTVGRDLSSNINNDFLTFIEESGFVQSGLFTAEEFHLFWLVISKEVEEENIERRTPEEIAGVKKDIRLPLAEEYEAIRERILIDCEQENISNLINSLFELSVFAQKKLNVAPEIFLGELLKTCDHALEGEPTEFTSKAIFIVSEAVAHASSEEKSKLEEYLEQFIANYRPSEEELRAAEKWFTGNTDFSDSLPEATVIPFEPGTKGKK